MGSYKTNCHITIAPVTSTTLSERREDLHAAPAGVELRLITETHDHHVSRFFFAPVRADTRVHRQRHLRTTLESTGQWECSCGPDSPATVAAPPCRLQVHELLICTPVSIRGSFSLCCWPHTTCPHNPSTVARIGGVLTMLSAADVVLHPIRKVSCPISGTLRELGGRGGRGERLEERGD